VVIQQCLFEQDFPLEVREALVLSLAGDDGGAADGVGNLSIKLATACVWVRRVARLGSQAGKQVSKRAGEMMAGPLMMSAIAASSLPLLA
jgi:hypothetical protein